MHAPRKHSPIADSLPWRWNGNTAVKGWCMNTGFDSLWYGNRWRGCIIAKPRNRAVLVWQCHHRAVSSCLCDSDSDGLIRRSLSLQPQKIRYSISSSIAHLPVGTNVLPVRLEAVGSHCVLSKNLSSDQDSTINLVRPLTPYKSSSMRNSGGNQGSKY